MGRRWKEYFINLVLLWACTNWGSPLKGLPWKESYPLCEENIQRWDWLLWGTYNLFTGSMSIVPVPLLRQIRLKKLKNLNEGVVALAEAFSGMGYWCFIIGFARTVTIAFLVMKVKLQEGLSFLYTSLTLQKARLPTGVLYLLLGDLYYSALGGINLSGDYNLIPSM